MNYENRVHILESYQVFHNKYYILYLDNIEPYLHAASCLLSMGCTTALQSIIAGTPVIEIKQPYDKNDSASSLNGFADNFTDLHANNFEQLKECLELALVHPNACFKNLDKLPNIWHNCFMPNVSDSFAASIVDLIPNWNNESKSKFTSLMNSFSSYVHKNHFKVDQTKWPLPNSSTISSKLASLQEAFSFQNLRIVEVAPCLYFITRS